MSPIINIRDVIQEMDVLSDNFRAFLNIRTGEFILLSDEDMGAAEEGGPLDDYPDWQREAIQLASDVLFTDDYLPLPSQYDIHEYEIMKRFCYTVEDDELRDRLLYRISGRGAFRIFKDTIYKHEITDDWYEYRYQAFKEIVKKLVGESQYCVYGRRRRPDSSGTPKTSPGNSGWSRNETDSAHGQ